MNGDEWKSELISELSGALCKFQSTMSGVSKTSTANTGSFSYNYADLGSVWEAVHKPLTDVGLSVSQLVTGDSVVTVLLHVSGQWLRGSTQIIAGDGRLKGAQAMGSAITYARRYGLMAILGLPALDDDGHEASKAPNTFRAKSRKKIENDAARGAIEQETYDAIEQVFEGAMGMESLEAAFKKHAPTIKQLSESKRAALRDVYRNRKKQIEDGVI